MTYFDLKFFHFVAILFLVTSYGISSRKIFLATLFFASLMAMLSGAMLTSHLGINLMEDIPLWIKLKQGLVITLVCFELIKEKIKLERYAKFVRFVFFFLLVIFSIYRSY